MLNVAGGTLVQWQPDEIKILNEKGGEEKEGWLLRWALGGMRIADGRWAGRVRITLVSTRVVSKEEKCAYLTVL